MIKKLVSNFGSIYKLQRHNGEIIKYRNISGWLLSGDIGYYDDDGNVFLVDRISEFIISYGINISPAEIESVLGTHPAVSQVAVIGIPHETAGELPMAVVSRMQDKTVTVIQSRPFLAVDMEITTLLGSKIICFLVFIIKMFQLQIMEKELYDLVAKNLPGYCALRGGIKFLEKLPLTATGKIAKKQLQDMFAN